MRSNCTRARRSACAWAGWATRASRACADPSAYVEVPAGTYPYGDKKETLVKIAAHFRLGRYPVTNRQFRDFLEDKGYETRQWWSEAGWAWRQEEGVTEPASLARPAVEWSEPAGGGGKLLGGRSLQQMGRRAAAAGKGMGGRRPRRARLYVSLGRRLDRTGSAMRGRLAWALPRRSGCSLARAKLSAALRIWPATSGSGARSVRSG